MMKYCDSEGGTQADYVSRLRRERLEDSVVGPTDITAQSRLM
jgi:hypothetical protein